MKKASQLILYILLIVLTTQCRQTYEVTDIKSNNSDVDSILLVNLSSEVIISPYRTQLEEEMNEVLNTSAIVMEKGTPEGVLGNFVADLTYYRIKTDTNFNADFCVLNNGGLRASLPKGDITRGKLYELMPFENEIVIVELNEDNMIELLEYIRTRSVNKGASGVPVSGIRVALKESKIDRVFIGVKTFQKGRTYHVVTTDYLANGGDQMSFFKNPVSKVHTGIKLRDAIIEHVVMLNNKGIELNAQLDGRIYHAE